MIATIGSICSGIEAASVAWGHLGVHFEWLSEIAPFQSRLLAEKYPNTPNLGDMTAIPEMLLGHEIPAPDMICGGTPCQAFSLAGWKNGLEDSRGNLTLKFVDIAEANDSVRLASGKPRCRLFWENVEGVLKDKTNAFGCLISSLAGLTDALVAPSKGWPNAGVLFGPKRNVAWRVLDAKYFGLPQQRRRLYVIAGGTEFHPENVLFEMHQGEFQRYPGFPLTFTKEGHSFQVFREYTDCLYSAYGTKWNGNAAAYNGSLFVVQDQRIRRFSPLEGERLMGFPDNYTDLRGAKKTNRYQGIGNSWAVPVVRWIGERLILGKTEEFVIRQDDFTLLACTGDISGKGTFFNFGKDLVPLGDGTLLNCSAVPEKCVFTSLKDIVSPDVPQDIYISPVGCHGIIRRMQERNLRMNPCLEKVLRTISAAMDPDEIERISRIQPRGRFSESLSAMSLVEEYGCCLSPDVESIKSLRRKKAKERPKTDEYVQCHLF